MKVTEIAGLRFGEGLPKICVPLTAGDLEALSEEARLARDLPADLYEWRVDGFTGSVELGLQAIRRHIPEAVLLCTLRTKAEGGSADVNADAYEEKLNELIALGGFQLIDIELCWGEETVSRLVEKAKAKDLGVVISKHDFEKTPPPGEIVSALRQMHRLGADLPKVAVMPQSPRDVLELLNVTLWAAEELGPMVTMAMGGLGKLTRVAGQVVGSAMTFGAGQTASAPGQIGAEDLKAILEDVSF